MNIKHIFFKVLFKAIEKLLNLFTFLKYFSEKDKTKILLKYRDPNLEKLEEERKFKSDAPFQGEHILIIIPFKDKWILTQKCLQSLASQHYTNLNLHVVLVDNNSNEIETENGIENALIEYRTIFASIKCQKMPIPFNFSAINNEAVYHFKTAPIDIIFFLNNDIEFVSQNDLKNLISFFLNTKNIGVLGCSLIYPQTSSQKIIQHIFLAPGIKLGGAHPLKGSYLNLNNSWFASPRIVPATTGAAFIISYQDFIDAKGFDEKLPTAYQDLDLCLKMQNLDKLNWVLPNTYLIHHETVSRSKKISYDETKYLYHKWGNTLTHNKFFSRKISRWSETPTEALFEGNYPWQKAL